MHLNCQQLFTTVAARFYEEDPDQFQKDLESWQADNPGAKQGEDAARGHVHQKTALEVSRIFNRLNDIMTYAALAPLTAEDAGFSLKKLDLAAQVLSFETDRTTRILCGQATDQAAYRAAYDKEARQSLLSSLTIEEVRGRIQQAFPQARI